MYIYSIKTFTFPFDPHAQLDYQFKWAGWLGRVSDSIASFTVSCDPGLVIVRAEQQGPTIIAWVALDPAAPATIGTKIQVHCDIVTNSSPTPRKERRSFQLNIVAR